MKTLILCLLALTGAFASTSARADDFHAQHAYRYHGPYGDWDRGFHTYYGYQEQGECARNPGHYLCYRPDHFRDTDEVYIEERHMDNGYHRVQVYRDSSYSQLYVSYYVYDDGRGVRRCEYRDFDGDDVYVTRWTTETVTIHWDIWNQAQWDQGFDEWLVGTTVAWAGLAVATSSNNTDVELVALGVSVLGSISASRGRQKMDASGLETVVVQEHYHQAVVVR
jgi:hypothetical protein